MRPTTLLVLVGIGLLAATGTALAADNTAPLPDAGVDQTATVDSTVYLDASGSTDPDGEITSISWTVETPSGQTISPDCGECRRTEFDADTLGRYTVTLTVTDDDGATRTDTLYVTVTNETGPDVSLAGPVLTQPNTTTTFTATARKDTADLQTLAWMVNDSVVEREPLNGSSATVSFDHSFDTTGDVSVRAVVYDTLGNRGSTTRTVSVEDPPSPPVRPNGTTDNATEVDNTTNGTAPPPPVDISNQNQTQTGGDDWVSESTCKWEENSNSDCTPEADRVVNVAGEERRVEDINGEPGIQLQTGNGIKDYGKVGDLPMVERGNNGAYVFTGQGSVQDQLERASIARSDSTATTLIDGDSLSPEIGDGETFQQDQSNVGRDGESTDSNTQSSNDDTDDNNADSIAEDAAEIAPGVDAEDVSDQGNADSGADSRDGAYGIP